MPGIVKIRTSPLLSNNKRVISLVVFGTQQEIFFCFWGLWLPMNGAARGWLLKNSILPLILSEQSPRQIAKFNVLGAMIKSHLSFSKSIVNCCKQHVLAGVPGHSSETAFRLFLFMPRFSLVLIARKGCSGSPSALNPPISRDLVPFTATSKLRSICSENHSLSIPLTSTLYQPAAFKFSE